MEIKCRFCDSKNIMKYGSRNTKRGVVQRYLCRNCRKRFIENDGFIYSRYKAQIITCSLDLYYKGLSFRKIQDHLKQNYSINVSHVTILNWMKRYIKLITLMTNDLKPKSSEEWVADETVLSFNKDAHWLWDIIDKNTKFLIALHLTQYRFVSENNIFKISTDMTKGTPKIISTDGFPGYIKMVNDNYPKAKHNLARGIRDRGKTNVIERFQGNLKERYKVMRGFDSLKTAAFMLDGWKTYYNFVRPHMALGGSTPAEAAGIKLNLKDNKWASLIAKSVEVL